MGKTYKITIETEQGKQALSQLLSSLRGLKAITNFTIEEVTAAIKKQKEDNPNLKVFSLADTIERIYSAYPRKQGKAKGLETLVGYLNKGRAVAGMGMVRLNHHQVYMAVQQYALECEKNGTEPQYIKEFSTFMNKSVLDYVEVTKSLYEQGMQSKYGENWRDLKFEYR